MSLEAPHIGNTFPLAAMLEGQIPKFRLWNTTIQNTKFGLGKTQ